MQKFEELKASGNLPSPKGIALELLRLIHLDRTNINDLVQPIQADPVLAGQVLKIANFALYHQDHSIVSLFEAIKLLGFNVISKLALSMSIVEHNKGGNCPAFNYDDFWSISLLRALAMQRIAHFSRSPIKPEEAFTVGLVAEVGQLALAQVYPHEYQECLETSRENRSNHPFCKQCACRSDCLSSETKKLLKLEYDFFAINHNGITSYMLSDWGLSRLVIDAVDMFHRYEQIDHEEDNDEQRLAAQLVLASALAGEVQMDLCFDNIQNLSGYLEITEANLHEIIDCLNKDWPQWKNLLSIREHPSREQEQQKETQLRILLVDDDRLQLHILSTYLTQQGHIVTTSTNVEEAIEHFLETNPQVVITDYLMKPMDGLSFCKTLRTMGYSKWVYIIMITADKNSETLSNAFESGVNDFIGKPIIQQELNARLQGARNMIEAFKNQSQETNNIKNYAYNSAAAKRRLEIMSVTDPLTTLLTRRFANAELDHKWSELVDHGHRFAIFSLDLDLFKQVNDNYGHETGDQVLIHFANILKESVRSNDVVCRMGGEEFIVISPKADKTSAEILGERIRSKVEDMQPLHLGLSRLITVSIGAAIADKDFDKNGWSDTLKRSDQALYQAKAQGRNCFVLNQKNMRRHDRINRSIPIAIRWLAPKRENQYVMTMENISKSGLMCSHLDDVSASVGNVLAVQSPNIAKGRWLTAKVVRIDAKKLALEFILNPKPPTNSDDQE